MESIVIVVHLLVALAIIGLILLQRGKGAEAGASFGGGASQTVFGSQGGGDFFSKLTAVLAIVFFVTSFTLAIIAKNQSSIGSVDDIGIPVVEEVQESEIPTLESQSSGAGSDLPTVAPSADGQESDVPAVNN